MNETIRRISSPTRRLAFLAGIRGQPLLNAYATVGPSTLEELRAVLDHPDCGFDTLTALSRHASSPEARAAIVRHRLLPRAAVAELQRCLDADGYVAELRAWLARDDMPPRNRYRLVEASRTAAERAVVAEGLPALEERVCRRVVDGLVERGHDRSEQGRIAALALDPRSTADALRRYVYGGKILPRRPLRYLVDALNHPNCPADLLDRAFDVDVEGASPALFDQALRHPKAARRNVARVLAQRCATPEAARRLLEEPHAEAAWGASLRRRFMPRLLARPAPPSGARVFLGVGSLVERPAVSPSRALIGAASRAVRNAAEGGKGAVVRDLVPTPAAPARPRVSGMITPEILARFKASNDAA